MHVSARALYIYPSAHSRHLHAQQARSSRSTRTSRAEAKVVLAFDTDPEDLGPKAHRAPRRSTGTRNPSPPRVRETEQVTRHHSAEAKMAVPAMIHLLCSLLLHGMRTLARILERSRPS